MMLLEKIELTRQAMIEAGLIFGYQAKETLTLSYELDELINEFYKKSEVIQNDRKTG